ncbi:efflux RND transporter periplasmic adaptor subunit, partial [Herbaspirillum sp. 3C11]
MTLSFFKRRSVLIVLLVLVLLIAFMALRKRPAAPVAVVEKPAQVLEFLPGDIAVAQVEALRQVLPMSGALRALNQVAVKAKVAGEVKEVL